MAQAQQSLNGVFEKAKELSAKVPHGSELTGVGLLNCRLEQHSNPHGQRTMSCLAMDRCEN